MKKILHVNQHLIRANLKAKNAALPVLSVRTYKGVQNCFEAEIKGPSRLIYRPDKPLSCGARVWIETDSEVVCLNSTTAPTVCSSTRHRGAT